ncbi:MAG: replicative DNA helicase [Fibrobacteres bacterium]|nr:replicative DNA helicase [Fibrobacterota bacterium]
MDPRMGLPRSDEAERSVLGGILRDWRVLDDLISEIDPTDFYAERHRVVFEAMRQLAQEQTPVDLVTLSERLRREKKLEMVGGEPYLMDLADSVVSAAGISAHAKIVREKSLLRSLIESTRKINEMAFEDGEDTAVVLDRAATEIMQVANRRAAHKLLPIKDLIHSTLQNIATYGEGLLGTPSGFRDIDETLRGLRKQAMIVLAARPGVGKTALALNIALNAACGIGDPEGKRHPVAIFSLEMGYMELVERLICSAAEIDSRELHKGNYLPQKLQRDIEPIYHAPIYIDDTSGMNILELRARCKRLSSQLRQQGETLDLIVIDYLQLMEAPTGKGGGGGGDNRQAEVAQISRGLKQLAKEIDCPVLALSQLSREPAKGDSKPKLHHLRESGAIEQDADVVAFLHPDPEQPSKVEFLIQKHRAGPQRDIPLLFRKEFTRYYDYTDREEPAYGYE